MRAPSESKSKREYKVRWRGYGAESDTWEPESNLCHLDVFKTYQANSAAAAAVPATRPPAPPAASDPVASAPE